MYMCQSPSPSSSWTLPPPPPVPLVSMHLTLHLCLFFCLAKKIIYIIFSRFYIYVLIHDAGFSLSDLFNLKKNRWGCGGVNGIPVCHTAGTQAERISAKIPAMLHTGWPTVPVCLGLSVFLGCKAFSAKMQIALGKPEGVVILALMYVYLGLCWTEEAVKCLLLMLQGGCPGSWTWFHFTDRWWTSGWGLFYHLRSILILKLLCTKVGILPNQSCLSHKVRLKFWRTAGARGGGVGVVKIKI